MLYPVHKLPNQLYISFFSRLNIFLCTTLFCLWVFIFVYPFVPAITSSIQQKYDNTRGFKYHSQLAHESNIDPANLHAPPLDNRLIIPGIGVDAVIHEGEDKRTLDKGIWRRPETSKPNIGGNTVLTAHRFMYMSGPNTFYNLDKLKVGDKFLLFWEKKEYGYEIIEVKTISPNQTEIEQNTTQSIVTLYTCTPLWTSKERLVVIGKLIEAI